MASIVCVLRRNLNGRGIGAKIRCSSVLVHERPHNRGEFSIVGCNNANLAQNAYFKFQTAVEYHKSINIFNEAVEIHRVMCCFSKISEKQHATELLSRAVISERSSLPSRYSNSISAKSIISCRGWKERGNSANFHASLLRKLNGIYHFFARFVGM